MQRNRPVKPSRRLVLALALNLAASLGASAQDKSIVVASTTSTHDSGLFNHILPLFKAKTGIDVKVVAQGTGQALDTAQRGDADVVFVHAKPQEERFVAEGHGVKRFDVMYNDFVLIGPKSGPAKVAGTRDITAALQKIADAKVPFISRGDNSGTHIAELNLWKATGVDIAQAKGPWYRDIGQGMGAAFNAASATNAYVLSDRGTWLSFKNRGDLTIAVQGDPRLFNQYGVILVNPTKHPHVKADLGQAFVDWITSPEGQAAIAGYKINGEQLFFPNAQNWAILPCISLSSLATSLRGSWSTWMICSSVSLILPLVWAVAAVSCPRSPSRRVASRSSAVTVESAPGSCATAPG